jgi:hypothetical protein
VIVFLRIGSKEYKNRAMKEGVNPRPTKGMNMVNRASDGSVRKTEAMERASSRANTFFRVTIPRPTEKRLAEHKTTKT